MKKRFMKYINTIARCATLYRDGRLEGTGLGGYQAPYVLEICRSPGITQDQIAQELHVNRSSVTRQLTLLEENGFIRRERSGMDRRAIEVYPAEKMLELLPSVRGVLTDWHSALAKILTQNEQDTLAGLLERLAKHAETIV
ncbi:MarR family winged helix-turn-helix transcriptional regulator [Breznakiella homolactica]|uniref:MarR family transcriptional regulator n=1 Tax=Breznakiella homolactica TaxID=2798577 RepID=A0A7T7XLU9_9SPIR|nr:MarR family transcriptional regulator [Breznakiella homolactica]QQO08695.1 MarR family transcriptional regulator [Breznakiella homolactica]